jgi:hypothetical protein
VNEDVLPASRREELSLREINEAEKAKGVLLKYLQNNASSSVFPEYFGSGLYEARLEKTSFSRFTNKKENRFGVI